MEKAAGTGPTAFPRLADPKIRLTLVLHLVANTRVTELARYVVGGRVKIAAAAREATGRVLVEQVVDANREGEPLIEHGRRPDELEVGVEAAVELVGPIGAADFCHVVDVT